MKYQRCLDTYVLKLLIKKLVNSPLGTGVFKVQCPLPPCEILLLVSAAIYIGRKDRHSKTPDLKHKAHRPI